MIKNEVNVIISGYLDIVDSFIGDTYDYESIIEMSKASEFDYCRNIVRKLDV